ncbi:MAG: zinc-dependent peptidase [Cytophagales bacterium]|nr:zinc-dependent peptidase [Armatimonadota bacterium]
MFTWLQNHRRSEIRATPFPPQWRSFLEARVAHYAWLDTSERQRLEGDTQVFVAEKDWEGANGLKLTDEIKVCLAAQVCLLLLGWENPHFFPNVGTIIVYPSSFQAISRQRNGYMETESRRALLGEAWSGNLPVVISWEEARTGGEDGEDGHSVVLHEFAHKLDMLSGGADGVPPLSGGDAEYDSWAKVMSQSFRDLQRSVWQGGESVLDGYGAENEAEFFAVVTEAFFERPYPLRERHLALYEALHQYYRQDTAARWERWERRQTHPAP